MDQAIYESTTQKIFGVRGQWLFKFNSVTGALEDALRFTTGASGTSCICAIGGFLYIGVSWTPTVDYSLITPYIDEDIYIVNAAAFVLTSRLNLGSKVQGTAETMSVGWRYIVPSSMGISGLVQSAAVGMGLFSVSPANTATYQTVASLGASDCAYDASNGVLWVTNSKAPNIFCYNPDYSSFQSCFDTNGNLNTICGICYNALHNRVYAVDGTQAFYNFSAALAVPAFTNFAVNTLSTSRINANPFRIKSVNGLPFNPRNGQVLIPAWADDTVIVITPNANPLLDSTVAIAGFTAPYDIVSTPFKNFAVQTGATGLKEII